MRICELRLNLTDQMSQPFKIPSPEYEQACLHEVRLALRESPTLKEDGTRIDEIELTQAEGDPLIVAHIVRHGEHIALKWRLYKDSFTGVFPPGQAEFPDQVGLQMLIWASGG